MATSTSTSTRTTPRNSVLAGACARLAAINPAAFARLPKADAVAALATAIAARPAVAADARESVRASRKAITALGLLAKLEAEPAEHYAPGLFAACLVQHGVGNRYAVVELLRAYHAAQYETRRCESRRGCTAEQGALAAAGRARLAAAGAFD